MKQSDELLQKVISQISASKVENKTFQGIVKKVSDNTVTVLRDDDIEVFNVRLKAISDDTDSQFIIYPAVDSTVICSYISNSKTAAAVIQYSEISKIASNVDEFVFNDGELGGLVIIDELKKQLDLLSTRVDTIVSILETTITGVSIHPNPAWSGIIKPITSAMQKENFKDIEDTKIKH